MDMGMCRMLRRCPACWNCRVGSGTADITQGPAMTPGAGREQAVAKGIDAGAGSRKRRACTLLATGEMGIGNTTTSSAVAGGAAGPAPWRA